MEPENDEIKDWLLLNGADNVIAPEYLWDKIKFLGNGLVKG